MDGKKVARETLEKMSDGELFDEVTRWKGMEADCVNHEGRVSQIAYLLEGGAIIEPSPAPEADGIEAPLEFARALSMVAHIAREHGIMSKECCDGDSKMLEERGIQIHACRMVEALEEVVRHGKPNIEILAHYGLDSAARRLVQAFAARDQATRESAIEEARKLAKEALDAQYLRVDAVTWLVEICNAIKPRD